VTTESLTLKARPGNRTYLGATVVDGGVNFAVCSTVAESVAVCLFDVDSTETRYDLDDYDAGIWHGLVPDVRPGQAYGFRVTGPFDPARGLRCNPGRSYEQPGWPQQVRLVRDRSCGRPTRLTTRVARPRPQSSV
jgi:isoamylase